MRIDFFCVPSEGTISSFIYIQLDSFHCMQANEERGALKEFVHHMKNRVFFIRFTGYANTGQISDIRDIPRKSRHLAEYFFFIFSVQRSDLLLVA